MDIPARALVIAAHPDDADFGAGGLIALWTAQGCEVTVVCITDGDSGGFDVDVPRADVPGIRRAEQQAASDALGVKECLFLGRPDGFVEVDRGSRVAIRRTGRHTAVDVTDVFEAKVRACSAHDSQTPMLDPTVEQELREMLGTTAREHGMAEGGLAEAYRVVDTA